MKTLILVLLILGCATAPADDSTGAPTYQPNQVNVSESNAAAAQAYANQMLELQQQQLNMQKAQYMQQMFQNQRQNQPPAYQVPTNISNGYQVPTYNSYQMPVQRPVNCVSTRSAGINGGTINTVCQ
jgi:hypothetical protein